MTAAPTVGRLTRAQICVSLTAFGVASGAWGAVVPAEQVRARLSDGRLGFVLLGVVVGAVATMRGLSGLIDRLGDRAVPVALVLVAIDVVFLGRSTHALTVGLSLIGYGAASGTVDLSINSSGSARQERTGEHVLSLAHAGFSFGLLGGGLAGGLARQAGSGPAGVLGGVAVMLGVIAVTIVPGALRRAAPEPVVAPVPGDAGYDGAVSWASRGTLIFIGVVCALSFLVEDAVTNWSSVHLTHTFAAAPVLAGLAPALFGLAQGVARVTLPRWSRFSPGSIVAVGGLLAGLGLALAAAAPDPAVALVGFVLVGVGLAATAPLLFGLAGASSPPATRARSLSLVTTFAYGGFFLGPVLTGACADVGGLRTAMAALGAVSLVLAGLATRLRPAGGSAGRRPGQSAGRSPGDYADPLTDEPLRTAVV